MHKKQDYVLKLVMVGPSLAGKSSILTRFADDQFSATYITTVGVDFRFKSIYLDDNLVRLQIWDTAGQERFRGVTRSYYKGAHAVILVYDITDPKSFQEVASYWLQESKQHAKEGTVFCLINKCDQGENTYIPEEHLAFLIENAIQYFKVSAKTRANITQAFVQITRNTMKIAPKGQKTTPKVSVPEKKKCC